MMALIRDEQLVEDSFTQLADEAPLPPSGAVIVSVTRWQAERDVLVARTEPVGVRLRSDESPDLIAADLREIAVVALEFPQFRDGRAYSYARILRERYEYRGEVRAVGDVLLDQLHFMLRSGFNSFEFESDKPLEEFKAAQAEFSVWYQPTGDGRPTAIHLRRRAGN